jgi:hypothetical protein
MNILIHKIFKIYKIIHKRSCCGLGCLNRGNLKNLDVICNNNCFIRIWKIIIIIIIIDYKLLYYLICYIILPYVTSRLSDRIINL